MGRHFDFVSKQCIEQTIKCFGFRRHEHSSSVNTLFCINWSLVVVFYTVRTLLQAVSTPRLAGINVKGTGTATITHNKIYDGNWGIVLKEAGGGDVSNNECYRAPPASYFHFDDNPHKASPHIISNYLTSII